MNPETMAATWSTRLHNIPLLEPILVGIACGLVAHRLRPWRLPGPEDPRCAAGWSLVGAGCTLNVWSWWASWRVELGDPHRLVTAGPYAISRNPMYVGWALLHLGLAMTAGSAWMLTALVPAAIVLHRQVLREEQQLHERFGEEYRRRCATVPRYVRILRLDRAP